MRLRIRHRSVYDYAEPARSVIQLVRKTPRSDANQFVRRWRIEVDADCRLDKGEDAYGNITHMFSIEGPIDRIGVTIEGEVETSSETGVVAETIERFPIAFWQRDSALTMQTPAVRTFARDIAMSEGGDPLSAAHAVSHAIHRDLTFLPGETDTRTTADDVLALGRGVCQDFAHLFIAAMRSLGRPARYVSGYFLRSDSEDQEAGHAWAETHIPGLGWVSFDPANDICADERHVRVAIGPDYRDAAPIRGARIGGSGENLTIDISVAATRPALAPQVQAQAAAQ
jgi:transglutaminase-like putative cysteine protease